MAYKNSQTMKYTLKGLFTVNLVKKNKNMAYLSMYNVNELLNKPFLIDQKREPNSSFPKISVITASYNQGKFLERTILSVLNQQYPNLEFIIVDGGSTDESLSIIKKYEKHLAYWVSEKDSGQANAINKGFNKATGDLLCFQNSDDLFCDNSFNLVAEAFKNNPKMDVFYGDMLMIDAEDNVLEILKTNDFDIKAQVLEGMQIFNQSMYFKKSLGEKYGFIEEKLKFVIDYENTLRYAINGAKFKKVDKLLGAFRKHEDAKTSNLEVIRATEHEEIRSKYFNLIFSENQPSKLTALKLRLNKLLYFIGKCDFSYLLYRNSLRK